MKLFPHQVELAKQMRLRRKMMFAWHYGSRPTLLSVTPTGKAVDDYLKLLKKEPMIRLNTNQLILLLDIFRGYDHRIHPAQVEHDLDHLLALELIQLEDLENPKSPELTLLGRSYVQWLRLGVNVSQVFTFKPAQ